MKVTVPKSAKGTRAPFSSKSWASSQHSNDCSPTGDVFAYLNDPFSVSLTKSTVNTSRELVGHALALGVVGDDRSTRCGRGRSDCQSHAVSGGERDATEVVGVVRVPLVPCIVGRLSSTVSEVDSGLQDRC